ncbi:MAG: protein-glutamate methylesterase/protein-glutamine glutaminase [Alphaproteobacteria bacterium]
MSNSKISVILVDDSSVIRGALSRILTTDPDIEVVSSVANGEVGVTMARAKKPDVLILDVEMPVMDGLTALPKILEVSPDTKVVMCSSLTAKGGEITMKAMALGAVECIVKPSSAQETGPNSPFQLQLLKLVRTLGGAVDAKPSTATKTLDHSPTAQNNFSLRNDNMAYKGKPSILAIGSSTGGPQALFQVTKDLGKLDIPIVITQHMPPTFTKILATHIQQQSGIEAYEGEDGMVIENGNAYVAPGGKHMLFVRDGTSVKIKLNDGPQENFCKPAVDPMMRSLIDLYGQKVLFAILTGMGQDGLLGARALIEKGGRVIAQDKATSVVWGMPGAVSMDGICSAVLPLNEVGPWLKKACFAR